MANTRETLGEQATLDGLVSRTLTELVENGVTSIGAYILYGFSKLTKASFPALTTLASSTMRGVGLAKIDETSFPVLNNIGQYGFAACPNLETVELVQNVVLSAYAFQSCPKLKSVDFKAAGNASIPASTFNGCKKLDTVIIRSTSMKSLSNVSAFSGTPIAFGLGGIYVPDELVDTYKANNNWKQFLILPLSEYPKANFDTITDSWADILAAEADGTYLTKYHIDDTKTVTVNGVDWVMQIVAFDADDLADGSGKAHITWLGKLCKVSAQMNSSGTNSGGWASSKMRSDLQGWYDGADADLKAAVKPVTKTYYDHQDGAQTKSCTDTFWIPSMRELGFTSTPYESEGPVYSDVFTNDASRIKYNADFAAAWYWSRTCSANTANFRNVSSSGSAISNSADYSGGVLLGFCS